MDITQRELLLSSIISIHKDMESSLHRAMVIIIEVNHYLMQFVQCMTIKATIFLYVIKVWFERQPYNCKVVSNGVKQISDII